ncbi:unnamed protein product [Urochloa humidicola]
MEERSAVTAATGALGPVLKKLTALLGGEYVLQEGTQRAITSIKSGLEPVHDLIGKLWGMEDLDAACEDWMTEARELSYDMDGDIDRFTLDLEHGSSGYIQREATDSPFKKFVERANGVSKQCREMQKIGDAIICNHNKLTTDPRAVFLHKDASELVGMGEKVEELIRLLKEHEMVCIVGFAGMGKTTLADLLYSTFGHQFDCGAFVSVHLNPNMMHVLGTILSQVTDGATSASSGADEPASEENIINDISSFLYDKRYLVIIDDIWHWEEWDVIQKALPKNNLGFKIILTTRIDAIVEKCQTEQSAHVYTQSICLSDAERLSTLTLHKSVEGDIIEANAKGPSTEIAYMSRAMPLAVTCLSSAWAENRVQGECWEWDSWESHTLDRFLTIPSMKPLVRSLCVGFNDLPVHLRTCLLYCSIYPPEYEIERGCLVRKWIAEGFVSQDEVAEAYIDKLVSRSLLQPSGYHNIYTVHPMMLAFLVCKAKEDNLVACRKYSGLGSSQPAKKIRRLSLYTDRYPDEEDVSHILSLHVLGLQPLPHDVPFDKFENLRVLEIDSKGLENSHLVGICGLIRLRYLGLKGAPITELPQEIGRLENLETLHVRWTSIRKLPMEIEKLQRLRTLNVADTEVTELPKEIEKLQNLRTLNISGTMITEVPREVTQLCRLENLDVSYTEVRELHIPQHLRTLDISGTVIREVSWSWRGIPNSSLLSVVVGHHFDFPQVVNVSLPGVFSESGDELIISSPEAKCREDLSILVLFNRFGRRCEVLQVRMLRVAGRHMNVPMLVQRTLRIVCSLDIRLCKLVKEDLDFLKQMPNLQALQLRFEVLPPELVAITGGGFLRLETFYVDCRLPRVTFHNDAMPKLKHLEFKFYSGTARQHYSMGITHLPSLEKVVFRCSEYYTSNSPGIRATIEVVRKEAAEHPKEITLYVNDMKPEVFDSGTKWISQEDRAIVENEFEEWEKEIKRRERIVAERAESIREQRHQLFTAAEERRAQRDKSNARSAIEKEMQERKSILEKREQRLRERERYYDISRLLQ